VTTCSAGVTLFPVSVGVKKRVSALLGPVVAQLRKKCLGATKLVGVNNQRNAHAGRR